MGQVGERSDHFSHEFTYAGWRDKVDIGKLLIALPREGDSLIGSSKGELTSSLAVCLS